jgi:hypothetical protein
MTSLRSLYSLAAASPGLHLCCSTNPPCQHREDDPEHWSGAGHAEEGSTLQGHPTPTPPTSSTPLLP